MELLDRVKKVEAKVAGEVERARMDFERKVAVHREECERKSESAYSRTLKKCEAELGEAKSEAEKDASLILRDAGREITRIRGSSSKNYGKAVDFILDKLGG